MLSPSKKRMPKGSPNLKKRRTGSKGSGYLTLPGKLQLVNRVSVTDDPAWTRLLGDLEKTQQGFNMLHKLCDALFLAGTATESPFQVFDSMYLTPCAELKEKFDKAKKTINDEEKKANSANKTKLEKQLVNLIGGPHKQKICNLIQQDKNHAYGGKVGEIIRELEVIKLMSDASMEDARADCVKYKKQLSNKIKELVTKRDDAYQKVKKAARNILDGTNACWIKEEHKIMHSPVMQAARKGDARHLRHLLFSELNLTSIAKTRSRTVVVEQRPDQTLCNSPRMRLAMETPGERAEKNKALLMAAASGHYDVTKAMLEAKADINTTNKFKHTPLFCAAQRGHVKIVKELIAAKADVEAKNSAGKIAEDYAREGSECMRALILARSPLMRAASKGIIENVRKMLKKHPINKVEYGRTPLLAATRVGDLNAIKILVALKADIEAIEMAKKNSLMYAAEQGRVDIVKFILQSRANPHALDKSKKNAIHRAAAQGHVAVVQLLAKANANLDQMDVQGRTVIHTASRKGHARVVKALLDFKVDPEARSMSGETSLMHAARTGNSNVVKVLISAKANVETKIEHASELSVISGRFRSSTLMVLNSMDSTLEKAGEAETLGGSADNSDTPLIHCSRTGKLDVVKALVEGKCNLESRGGREYDKLGKRWEKVKKTALICASEGGHKDVVKYLVSRRANLEAHGVRGKTALHRSYERGKSSMIELLVECHANPNSQNKGKKIKTILSTAADDGELHFVRCMLKVKANVNEKDCFEETALILAVRRGFCSIVSCLVQAKADIEVKDYVSSSTPLLIAATEGQVECAKCLILANATIDTKDGVEGKTPLMKASANGRLPVVTSLLEAHADPNDIDEDDRTAIFEAAKNGKIDIVKALVASKAEINGQDWTEMTPLMEAVSSGHIRVVKFLVQSKADINMENEDEQTAIIIAREKKMKKTLMFLESVK